MVFNMVNRGVRVKVEDFVNYIEDFSLQLKNNGKFCV